MESLAFDEHEKLHNCMNEGVEYFVSKRYKQSLRFFLNLDTKSVKVEIRRDLFIARSLFRMELYLVSIPFYLATLRRIKMSKCDLIQYVLQYEIAYVLHRSSYFKSSQKICDIVLRNLKGRTFLQLSNPYVTLQEDEIYRKAMRLKIVNFVHLGQLTQAKKLIQYMIVKDPKEHQCLSYRAIFQKTEGKYIKSLRTINQAISLDPKNWRYFYFRGRLYGEKIGDHYLSLEDFKMCFKINSKCFDCLKKISELYRNRLGDPKKEKKYLKKYHNQLSKQPEVYGLYFSPKMESQYFEM